MIGAVLAVAASLGYGGSSVLSGLAMRRHSTAALALRAQAVGLIILGVAVAVIRPAATLVSLGWGAAAGAVAACAVLLFFTALQRGTTAVVAPVAGCGVIVPVLAGLLGGEAIGWLAGVGVLVSFTGVLIVASAPAAGKSSTDGQHQVDEHQADQRQPGDHPGDAARTKEGTTTTVRVAPLPPLAAGPGRCQPMPAGDGCVPPNDVRSGRSAVIFAAAAALFFGLFFVALDRAVLEAPRETGTDSLGAALFVALAVQIGSIAITLIAATRHTRVCVIPGRSLVAPALAVGFLDVISDLLLLFALGRGPLAIVGPLGSLAPMVTILIAVVALHQRMGRLQVAGVGASLVGIALIVIG